MDKQLPLFDKRLVASKLADANLPGFEAEFDPDEADAAGAFVEDALSADEALEGSVDVLDLLAPEPPAQPAPRLAVVPDPPPGSSRDGEPRP